MDRISITSSKALFLAGALLAALSTPIAVFAQDIPAHNPAGLMPLRGTVQTATANKLTIQTDTGSVAVKLVQPFHVYTRVPSSLADVKETSFIGVTTVKQPDGTQKATEIHVFPEALRGLGEGSYMMQTPAGSTPSRMTNGKVSSSAHMSGSAPSRMTNGSVQHTNGSTLVVTYSGGALHGVQHVVVPAGTPVMSFQLTSTKLNAGDKVFVMAKKAADGSYSSNEAISIGK